MKKSRITLLVASLLCLGLGIGSVFALDVNGSTKTQEVGVDDAMYLYWGDDDGNRQTSVTIEKVDDLVTGHNQYRYISVLPKSSANATATVNITFKLDCTPEPGDENLYDLNGLTVNVYRTATDLRESGDNPNLSGLTPTALVYDGTKDKNEVTVEFNVTSPTDKAYYCLEFVLAVSHDPATGHEWGGKMTISQSFTTPTA